MADLLLRIEATFQDNASRGILGMLNPLRFIEGAFGRLKSGGDILAFTFRNWGAAGFNSTKALQIGIRDLAMGFAQLAVAAAVTAVVIGSVLGVIIGVLAVKAAADFQQGLNRLVTGAGDVTDNMQKMGQGILQVSTDTGILTGGTDGLNAAMYLIISSGQRGAQALDTLSVAAKGAQIEQAKVTDVANVLSGAMTNYGTKQFNATQFMNGFIVAVQNGKITLQQLAVAMGPIDPIAQQLGIHFNDVAAAMTTQTNAMIPAARAATALRFMMLALENPTKKAKTEMAALGLDSVKVANEMKTSLPGALQMIYNAAKKAGPEGSVPFNRAVGDMVGGIRGLTAFLALTGTHMKDFTKNSAAILAAMKANRDAVIGWDTAQSNFNVQMDRAKAAVQALLITIGTALLPVLTSIVQKIVPLIVAFTDWVIKSHAVENAMKAITPVLQAIGAGFMAVWPTIVQIWQSFVKVVQDASTWLAQNKGFMEALKWVVIALGVAIGVILMVALLAIIAVFLAIGIVIVVVVAIVQAFIQVVRSAIAIAPQIAGAWNTAIAWIVARWNELKNAAVDVFNRTKTAIVNAFNATIAWIKNAWHTAISWIVGQWNTLVNAAKDVWGRIGQAINTAVSAVVGWLKNIWQTAVQAVVNSFKWLYDHNYYFQQQVDMMKSIVTNGIAWLKNAWSTAVKFVKDRWNELATAATDTWTRTNTAVTNSTNKSDAFIHSKWSETTSWLKARWDELATAAADVWGRMGQAINTATTFIGNIIRTAWNATLSFLSGIWNTIWGKAKELWANITGATNTGISNVKAPITGFGSWASSFFGGLASQAVSWGAGIVNGLANGIRGAIGNVISAAKNVAATIASFLGFHSSVIGPAKEGPGMYLADWGPGIANGIANGMLQGLPQVRAAAASLLQPFGNISAASPVTGGSGRGTTSGSHGGGITVVIEHIHVNDFSPNMPRSVARQMADAFDQELGRRYRSQYSSASSGIF